MTNNTPSVLSVSSVVKTFGWGLFCACSWTWCIGMFLPVIMIDRWGWVGFLVFAIPNVIGCTAFGYVLRSRERARKMMDDHRSAMRLFSIITLAYHVFFIGFIAWLLTPVELEYGKQLAVIAPIALLAISTVIAWMPDRAWLVTAVLVYGCSLAAFAMIGLEPLADIATTKGELIAATSGGLIWLIPALTFGFLLCPYLDLTFHRALQRSPSRHAFLVFGLTFTVMIVLTAAYWDALATGFTWVVLSHITAQSIFTMAAHQRELRATIKPAGFRHAAVALIPVLALPLAFVGAFFADALAASIDMYLRFLVFYGLIFPAYVLLFMSPLRVFTLNRAHLIMFAVMLLAFAPLYELGFIHDWTWLAVIPPIALIMAAIVRGSQPNRLDSAAGSEAPM